MRGATTFARHGLLCSARTRAQQAGEVRPDTDLSEVIQMVGGIAKIQAADPRQIEHILGIALDGLRYRAGSST